MKAVFLEQPEEGKLQRRAYTRGVCLQPRPGVIDVTSLQRTASWRRMRKSELVDALATLQWGRGSSAAESVGMVIVGIPVWGRFNGAAALQPRKDADLGDPELIHRIASMGPRLFSRGKDVEHQGEALTALVLQWGRGSSAAERMA